MNRHTYIPETWQRFLAGPGEQEASLIRDFDAPSQAAGIPAADGTQQQLFKQSFSGLTSQSHSITTLRDSTHFTLRYCLPSVTPALLQAFSSSFPAAFSSFLHLPALLHLQLPAPAPAVSSSAHLTLRRFTDVPRPIPSPADDLIQCPLTSSARYRPDQTTSVFFTIHRLQIKTRFPSSTTDHLRLSSFFAIAISLPLCPFFSCTVDWHSHLSARCNSPFL
ncbi:unnamed protein product [Acanthosepion pharaonis]|uniref:Uncharacterized protein n=1 Tax=Acanthosepion pharaonis TaxID=158019 RepID=A0A812BZI5_ACAPH|nr:unnamed protein product [Sepia pharaonis]